MTGMRYVDVDGHILEPADLWLEYIEPAFRDRAMWVEEDRGWVGVLERRPAAHCILLGWDGG